MFHVYIQNDARDCGVSCLRMICRHHGQRFSERELSELCHTTRNGVLDGWLCGVCINSCLLQRHYSVGLLRRKCDVCGVDAVLHAPPPRP